MPEEEITRDDVDELDQGADVVDEPERPVSTGDVVAWDVTDPYGNEGERIVTHVGVVVETGEHTTRVLPLGVAPDDVAELLTGDGSVQLRRLS